MRKFMTILAALLAVLALIAGSVWGYLWYSTQQQIEQLVMAAKPFAEISYDSIEVSLSGSAGVKQIKIIPHSVNDIISISALRLNAPNILALLNIRSQLGQGQLPAAMSLTLRGLELPLHGGIIGPKPPAPRERKPFDDLDTLGCGPVIHFSGDEWQEMGYERFISNLDIGYRLDANRMQIRVNSNARDWASISLDMGFALNTPATSIMELAQSLTPKLTSLNVVLQDDGYNTRRSNYCAAKAGKPINEYIADHVRLVVERLRANGIQPGPGLIAAYQGYLAENGSLTLTANPPAPIDPSELALYKAEDVVKLTGLTVKVNDQAISDLRVEWNNVQVVKALGIGAPSPPHEEEAPATVTPTPKPVVIQHSFHPIAVSQLKQHVGKIAKLQTSTGAHYRGKLEMMADGMVKITIRKPGGTATLSLRSEEITGAEVLY